MTQTPVVPAAYSDARCDDKREEFLLEVYRQTSSHLGRHVLGVWQCVGVVGAALIVFAQENDQLNDYTCTLVVLLCGWLAATTLDASNWFNRNLAIISNIERLFLSSDDLKLVHYFFGQQRPPGRHAKHFKIQFSLAAAVAALILIYHVAEQILPDLPMLRSNFELSRALPYASAAFVSMMLARLANHYKKKDREFLAQSPGFHFEGK